MTGELGPGQVSGCMLNSGMAMHSSKVGIPHRVKMMRICWTMQLFYHGDCCHIDEQLPHNRPAILVKMASNILNSHSTGIQRGNYKNGSSIRVYLRRSVCVCWGGGGVPTM